MRNEAPVMGLPYAEWERVTDAYLKGMEALRRREPGASAYLARLARELQQCQARSALGVYESATEVPPYAMAKNEEKAQPKARRGTWTASAWDVLVKPRRFKLKVDRRLRAWR